MADDSEDAEGRYTVSALAQGLSILSLFSQERRSMTAPQIAQALGIPRATAFRLLRTLQAMGFLARDADERHYRLGPAVLVPGYEGLASLDMVEVAQPILQRLRDETGLSTHMAVRDHRDVVYVARYPIGSGISSQVSVGTRFPVHATVMGRVLICDLTDPGLAALFAGAPMERFSDQTPTSLDALKLLLAADRARGYAVSQAFFQRGVSAIAVPVRNREGRTVAAINVTAIDAQMDTAAIHGALKDAVLAAAAEIGQWLGSGDLPAVSRAPPGSSSRPSAAP